MATTQKASIIYRGNNSLDGLVPMVEDALKEHGFPEVLIKRFEPGTEKESIAEWVNDNTDKILGSSVLMDETCYSPLYRVGIRWRDGPRFFLDRISNNAAIEAIKAEIGHVDGSSYEDRILDPRTTLERTKVIYKHVLSNVCRKPTSVYILNPNLTDHVPFRKAGGDIRPSELLKSWFEDAFDDSISVTIIGEGFTHYGVMHIPENEKAKAVLLARIVAIEAHDAKMPKAKEKVSNQMESRRERVNTLAAEISEFPFPGVDPEAYRRLKAAMESDKDMSLYDISSPSIDELIERFKNEGMKVTLGDTPKACNIFIMPTNSIDIQSDSLFPKHLQLNGEVGDKLKELILLQKQMRSFEVRS